MHVELVRTVTRDGLRLDGALVEAGPAKSGALGKSQLAQPSPLPGGEGTVVLPKGPFGATAAILLHGVASNFYTLGLFEALIQRLTGLGIAALSVNTRGRDSVYGTSVGMVRRRMGAAYEIVDDCRMDIGAWIDFLNSRGHGRVLLIGHSLGAIKAVYAAAKDKRQEVAGIVAVSPPRLSYSAFMNAGESSLFWESMQTAEDLIRAGQGEELFTSKYPFPLLITAAAYLDKYGPEERYNILNFAAEVPCPALFVYGSKELSAGGIAFAGLPEALKSLAGCNSRSIETVEGADHFYTGMAEPLAARITAWLELQ